VVEKRLEGLKDQHPSYLLHEYLNKDWNIENFLTMNAKLEGIKLKFCCSANLLNTVNSLNFTKEQAEFLKSIHNRAAKEYITDLYWLESFRKDYWAKGPRQLSIQDQWESIKNFEVIQLKPRADIPLELPGREIMGSIDNKIYNTVMELIEGSVSVTIGELAEVIASNSQKAAVETTRVLLALGYIGLVTNEVFVSKQNKRTNGNSINDVMCRESVKRANAVTYLCSPKTGDAIPLSRSTLIYLHARQTGHNSFESACLAVVRKCAENNEIFQHKGKALTIESEAHEFIMDEVGALIDKYGPILAKHGIILER